MKTYRLYSHRLRRSLLLITAALLFALSFLSAWYFNSRLSVNFQLQRLQHYITAQQRDAEKLLADTMLMRKLVLHSESEEEFKDLTEKAYGFFLFAETLSDNQDLLFWNNQRTLPPKAEFDTSHSDTLMKFRNGYYVSHKEKLALHGMTNNVIAYVLIPVLHQYYLEAQTSPTTFAHNKEAIKKIRLADEKTPFPVRSVSGKILFYIQPAPNVYYAATDAVTVVLRLTALILLLIALHLFAETIFKKTSGVKGMLFLAFALLCVRVFIYFVPIVFSLRSFPLFDPTIYASTDINNSLGDLLINAVLLCWIVLFAWNHLGPIKKIPAFVKGKGLFAAGLFCIFLLMFTTFQLAEVVNNLVVNSKISFQVTDFSLLTIYTGISFLILALLSLSYYYFSRLIFRVVLLAFPNLAHLYFAVAIVGLIFLSFQKSHSVVLFQLPVLMWLVLYTLLLTQEQSIINRFRFTIASLLFWMFVFSISLAALIMQGNRERDRADRKAIARKYEELTEPTKENVLSIAMTYLNNSFLQKNFYRFYNETENAFIRDSITNNGLAAYANVYNTGIYVYDAADKPVNNSDNKTYNEINNIYSAHSSPADNPSKAESRDFVYYETSPTQFVYLVRREIFDTTQKIGTLFIIATPKQFHDPEPLDANIFNRSSKSIESNPAYIRAIYKNNKLVQYAGHYPFSTQLREEEIPENDFTERDRQGFTQLWFKGSNHKIIVVGRKKDSLIESITLFSYLFCSFLFMVSIIRLFGFLARLVKSWPQVDFLSRLSIRSQIHVTIIFISVLSFVIIGIATISYFVKRYQRNNIETLSHTAAGTLDELQRRVKASALQFTAATFTDSVAKDSLLKLVADISDVHGVIINLYDKAGTLQITSDNRIYQHGVLSLKMDPTAFYHLNALQEVQRVQNETASDFPYLSIYLAIRNSNTQDEPYAYLNIPSFSSETGLNQEISNFLVTIINLNAFIVLIAGVIALFITNRITRSFSVISDKMKAITLGRSNEEIEWNKEDEIGELVKQYNKMVQQLEQSANALAKSEREGAWREMARQVAHEIKNPLTPMKLSIQYLQKAIQNNQPNVKELTTNVANTLIEQIDHLSKIAADFSQFANIGNKRLEVVDLHNVLRSLMDLYATNPNIALTWQSLPQPLNMRVDKTHMNRLFTNLLTNAVDACPEQRKCVVKVAEAIEGDQVIVSVADNGDGIPDEMRSKIFTPNFTTKTSGTGLGLAMCKSIVEQAGGDIWFETKEGEGTVFFVRLPIGE